MPEGQLAAFLRAGVASGLVSAAVAAVADRSGLLRVATAGRRAARGGRPVRQEDLFDASSLTKPWIATLALRLDAAGRLPLPLPVGDVFPAAPRALARRTLEDLLRHRAGLAAWTPLFARLRGPVAAARLEAALLDPRLLGERAGTYSDLGYLLWACAARRATGERVAALLAREVAAPLGARPEVAPVQPRDDLVACRLDNGREIDLARRERLHIGRARPRPGEAQDGNARFLARALADLPGHAGLFLRVPDLVALGREWLAPEKLLARASAARALGAPAGPFALGWARRSREGSSGLALSRSSFGHTGFAGGSLWIDPERERIFVLLAHRIDSAVDINPFRRAFHRLAVSPQE